MLKSRRRSTALPGEHKPLLDLKFVLKRPKKAASPAALNEVRAGGRMELQFVFLVGPQGRDYFFFKSEKHFSKLMRFQAMHT
jgi:hypothetical protein